jgi:hypothetical protein
MALSIFLTRGGILIVAFLRSHAETDDCGRQRKKKGPNVTKHHGSKIICSTEIAD